MNSENTSGLDSVETVTEVTKEFEFEKYFDTYNNVSNYKELINTVNENMSRGYTAPRFTLNEFAAICRAAADSFYYNPVTGQKKEMNEGERYMLIVSEIVEAFEGVRKNKMDDHIPWRLSEEVENADALIREFDHAKERKYDLDGSFWEKLKYNSTREDHKPENRAKPDGKKW